MKRIYKFEVIQVKEGSNFDNPRFVYHDDYFGEGIDVPNDFPQRRLFIDFRIFNGVTLEVMDNLLVKLKELLLEITDPGLRIK